MTTRKGMMVGSGRRGYYNIIGKDPLVHRHSAMGIKQPQRLMMYGKCGGKWQYGDREIPVVSETKDDLRIAKFRKIARQNDIDPVLFEEFMMRAFPDATGGYEQEWAERFKKGNPLKYMDSKTAKIYTEVIEDYKSKYFKGGKLPKKSDLGWSIETKKFRNKKTGEIVTQVPLLDIADYEEVKGGKYGEWMKTMPTANPALTKPSNEKLLKGTIQEHIEHPKFTIEQARQIAKDHLQQDPRYYGKKGGKITGLKQMMYFHDGKGRPIRIVKPDELTLKAARKLVIRKNPDWKFQSVVGALEMNKGGGGKMSKKDYIVMAQIIGKMKDPAERELTEERYIRYAKKDNPRFDEIRFIKAVEKAANN